MSNGRAVKIATAWVSAALLTFLAVAPYAASAQPEEAVVARTGEPGSVAQPARKPPSLVKQVTPANRFTVGLVTGAPTGTDAAMTHEIATVLAAGQETGPKGEVALRVLGMTGLGGVQNVRDVLTLPGADMGIVPVVLLNRLRDRKEFGDLGRKLAYIAPLHTEEVHILARSEIGTVADLAGKTVNLGEEGGATDLLAREILAGLGVKVEDVNVDQKQALERMKAGEIAATVIVTGKPSGLLSDVSREAGFRFLPIPLPATLDPAYLPSNLTHEAYPNLIGADEQVETLAVGTVLVAYDWPRASDRNGLLGSFVEAFFSRFSEFQAASRHPKWKEVNIAAELPGWRRFGPAERWLKRAQPVAEDASAQRVEFDRFLDQTGSVAPAPADRARLFEDFLQWRRRQ